MSFTIGASDRGAVVDSVTCMSNISQHCMVRLHRGTLTVSILDHDAVFMVTHTMRVQQQSTEDDATIHLKCVDVIAGLAATAPASDVSIRIEGTKWYLPDRTWTTARQRSGGGRLPFSTGGHHVRVKTANFLLYIRQILVCENSVCITSHGHGDLTLQASGELISIRINDSSDIPVSTDQEEGTQCVDCSPKYIRAMLSVLSPETHMDLYITDKKHVVIQSGRHCTIVLKDVHGSK